MGAKVKMPQLEVPRKHPEVPQHPPPWWQIGRTKDKKWAASVCCPRGHMIDLGKHYVTKDGLLLPALVVCDEKGCDFHAEGVRLLGWRAATEGRGP